MKTALGIIAIAMIGIPSGVEAQLPKPSEQVRVVAQLYNDFACEAVLSEPRCDNQHALIDQPRASLTNYFDESLTRLWLADRACVERTREICRLDFSPIWNSQAPEGTFVRVLPGADAMHVNVELLDNRAPQKTRTLQYTLAKTPAGFRIHDINDGAVWSLQALLSPKGEK